MREPANLCEGGAGIREAHDAARDLRGEDEYSRIIIGAAIEVHRQLGPGLLESAYEVAPAHELSLREIHVARQVTLPAVYKGIALDDCYRIDLLVADRVIVEVKAVKQLSSLHEVQLLTYLKFSGKKLGLLMNFHAATMKGGTKRIVLDL
jgi:GxxExxY protein